MSVRVDLAKARLRLAADRAEPLRYLRAASERLPFVITPLLRAAAWGLLSRQLARRRLHPSRYNRLGR